jgi:hypothetical protein
MSTPTGSANTDIVALLGGTGGFNDTVTAIQGVASRVLSVSTTQAGTGANTDETTLWSYALPANTLSANGKGVRITVYGTTAANANTKTRKLYFGATAVANVGDANNNANWVFVAVVTRTGASAQISMAEINTAEGAAQRNTLTTPAEDTTGAITISVTGQNGTANADDIVFRGAIVETLN